MRKTGNPKNKYAFRTAPLRNVELTAPYGHDGAIVNLRSWVDHYSQPDVKLLNYNPNQLEPLLRGTLLPTTTDILATRDGRIKKLVIAAETVDEITEFLKALTDPGARNMQSMVPLRCRAGCRSTACLNEVAGRGRMGRQDGAASNSMPLLSWVLLSAPRNRDERQQLAAAPLEEPAGDLSVLVDVLRGDQAVRESPLGEVVEILHDSVLP